MRVLLDTHAILWAVQAPEKLSPTAHNLIEGDNTLLISIASFWEIVIKTNLGKLHLGAPAEQAFPEILEALHAEILPIALDHVCAVAQLPPHHGDPFDRMLIAQSVAEDAPLVSSDAIFSRYAVPVVW